MNNEEIIRNLICKIVVDDFDSMAFLFPDESKRFALAMVRADVSKLTALDAKKAFKIGIEQVIEYLESNKE